MFCRRFAIRFCSAILDNSKQDVSPNVENTAKVANLLSVARPRAKKLSPSRSFAPMIPVSGALHAHPRYGLALRARRVPPKLPWFDRSSTLAPPLSC